jgi:hypothetical protein
MRTRDPNEQRGKYRNLLAYSSPLKVMRTGGKKKKVKLTGKRKTY